MLHSIPLLYLLLLPSVVSALPRGTRASPLPTLESRASELITPPNKSDNHWVDSWGSMPRLVDARDLPPVPFTTPEEVFANATLTQTVRLTLGGDLLRIRISNAFGGSDLPITGVSVALASGDVSGVSEVQEGTTQRLTFGGEESVTVPMGALVVSDPVQLSTPVKATTILTVSIYSKEGQKTNSITGASGEPDYQLDLPSPVQGQVPLGEGKAGVDRWYWLSGVEVWTATTNSAVIIIGDSITDGSGSTAAIASSPTVAGPASFPASTETSWLIPPSRTPIIFEGVNDILNTPSDAEAQTALAQRMIWGLKQIVERLHTQNIVVVGGTIAPFSEPGGNNVNRETTRRTVNEWIRTGRVFYSVVDFEKVLADPKSPEQLLEAYDTGDHLHPSVAGFQAMVDVFQLDVFDLGLPQGNRKPQ
ncbi:hypothetical protein FA13DRAFT_1709642 [Coprinellus micaceus]|uniref:SGNH hydrolase-type esterase domain-containing protein n=1 Tax=Coprinellus micaceus TaxID=71717 RepID=A0A4Y7TDW6_COPMI|nr:hypothetical protein FA13DRAFT_1709642 [Coprinellus micaceus]